MIAFHLFCSVYYRSQQFRVPAILLCLGRTRISFHLHGIPHLLISLKRRIFSFPDVPDHLGFRRLCRLARPVSNILVFDRFFLKDSRDVCKSVKPFLESIISTEFSLDYRKEASSPCFF